MKMGIVLSLILWGLLTVSLTGCGQILGVSEFELFKGGPKMTFQNGTDFHLGANSIADVDDRRGISSFNKRTIKVQAND